MLMKALVVLFLVALPRSAARIVRRVAIASRPSTPGRRTARGQVLVPGLE